MRDPLVAVTVLIGALLVGAANVGAQGAFVLHRDDAAAIAAPRSIVSADFNRDGFPDIALGGTGRDSVGILLHHGLGDGDQGQRFKPLKEIVVGGGPFELAAADLNKDGLVDIAVANADLNAVTILLNDRSQAFTSVAHVPVAQSPRGLAIADFNRDGNLDIIVTKYLGTTIDVLINAGNGTFPSRRSYAAPANAQGVAAGDLNHDGIVDAVLVSATGTVSVYTMNASGGAARRDERRAHGWNVVTTGDFNRDGYIDVAYASAASSVVEVMYRFPTGAHAWTGSPIPVAASPRGIETADVNRDGVLDLVVAGRTASMVSVLLRNANATGATPIYSRSDFAAGNGARDLTLVDFTVDGRMDILTANEFGNSTTLLANGTDFGVATFAFDPMPFPDAGGTEVFDVGDFDHNGKVDLVTANRVIFDGTTASRRLSQQFGHARSGAAGDFNADGHPDAVFLDSQTLHVYFGDGSRGFVDGPLTSIGAGVGGQIGWDMRAVDINRDGRLDVVVLSTDFSHAGALQIHLGRGDGTFTRSAHTEMPATARIFDLGDLDRDGVLDAVVADQSGVQVLLGDGAGGWKSRGTFEAGVPRYGVAIGDVTSDGMPDIVTSDMTINPWGVSWGPRLTVARGAGDGTFEAIRQYDVSVPAIEDGRVVYSLLLADLTADGQLDIFTTNGHLLAGSGSGEFAEPQRFEPQAFLIGYRAADVNRDGLLDLLGYTSAPDGWSIVMLNTRTPPSQNRAPVGITLPDTVTVPYGYGLFAEEESEIDPGRDLRDPDLHALRYHWTLADGRVVSRWKGWLPDLDIPNGSHQVTFTVDDYRGGVASKTFTLVVAPRKENVLHAAQESVLHGAWQIVEDASAADGVRVWHPNANAPKLPAALAAPTDYIDIGFLADPTQEYKLWIRMKADNNYWGNDSVFVQFSGAADAAGKPVYRIGTTSALAVNLEECANCGLSGWGWEDDGWGAINRNGVLLRFPAGGRQRLRIQTREDGLSIDQIVLSSDSYRTTRPGAARNDTTHLQTTGPWMGTWWFDE